MDKVKVYSRLPSSVEAIDRPRGEVVKTNGQVVEVDDRGRCFICGNLVDELITCDRCGFAYCEEHAGEEYHKCNLPKHGDDTKKELRLLAMDMRRLMGSEFIYEARLEK